MNRIKITNGVVLGSIIAVVFITLVTLVAGLNPLIKTWLKDAFGHHWVGKSILSVVIFATVSLFAGFFESREGQRLAGLLNALFWITALASILLLVFFTYEALT